jgi:hypothetical protein
MCTTRVVLPRVTSVTKLSFSAWFVRYPSHGAVKVSPLGFPFSVVVAQFACADTLLKMSERDGNPAVTKTYDPTRRLSVKAAASLCVRVVTILGWEEIMGEKGLLTA